MVTSKIDSSGKGRAEKLGQNGGIINIVGVKGIHLRLGDYVTTHPH